MTGAGRIRIFDRLPEGVYERIESAIRWETFNRGAEIISYNEKSTDIYFVRSGHVRSTMFSATGKEVTYQDLFEGEIFGELSAIDGLPRSANVVAIEPSTVGIMSNRAFKDIVHAHPEVSDAVMARLVSVIRELTDRVYRYDALSVKDRVRKEIVLLAQRHMTGPNTAVIPNMPKHADIANRIDTHREAVTRELNVLSKMGLIRQEQRRLTVTDVAGLADLLPEG